MSGRRSKLRRGALALAPLALFVAACVLPGQDGSGGVGGAEAEGGGGSGPTGCDARNSCESCAVCASEGACAQALAACRENPICVALDECMLYCQGDTDCDEMCRLQNATGLDEWDRAARCIYCDSCATACSGSRFCR